MIIMRGGGLNRYTWNRCTLSKQRVMCKKFCECYHFSGTEHAHSQVVFDGSSKFFTEQPQLVFTEHLTGWAIPPVKFAGQREFYSLICCHLRRTVLALCKMLHNKMVARFLPRDRRAALHHE